MLPILPSPRRLRTRMLPFLLIGPAILLAACSSTHRLAVPSHPRVGVVNAGEAVNSPYDDYAPELSKASRHILFTSNRPAPDGVRHGDDFWSTERTGTGWAAAMNEALLNSDKDEGSACTSPDGSTVYFVQCYTEDGFGDADIYTANIAGGKWQNIRNLGKGINTKYWDSMPFISPDGTELYFSSDRPGGYGGTDLYVCKLQKNNSWGEPKNLGPDINTSEDEKCPVISPGGEMLYFSSNGHGGVGGHDIFVSRLVRRKWSKPENAGTPINSSEDDYYFTLTAQEDSLIISSRRLGGSGGLDLWIADHNPFKDTTRYDFFVAGRVFDTTTNKTLYNVDVRVINRSSGETSILRTGTSGQFRYKTTLGASYELRVIAPGYHEQSVDFTVPARLSYNEYRKNIPLAPVVVEKPDTVRTPYVVYFDFDEWGIRDDAARALDAFLEYSRQKQVGEIRLDAHTDERGSEPYNIELSRKRGASVSRYLSGHGVAPESISLTPHGEANPASSNDTEEGRQLNRRVEIHAQDKRLP